MTDLDQAVFGLLRHSPEPADVLIEELRQWTEGGIYKGTYTPGRVLESLDKLCRDGKALATADGFRLMPDRPKAEQQRSMFE